MIELDCYLLSTARHLVTGANVHLVKEMMFAYEQAVQLHNDGWPAYREYDPIPEQHLRQFVQCQRHRRPDQHAKLVA